MSFKHIAESYPYAVVQQDRVYFLRYEDFKALENLPKGRSVSLDPKYARISAPKCQIEQALSQLFAFDCDVSVSQDEMQVDIHNIVKRREFKDVARFVYLSSCFSGNDKKRLFEAFRDHWRSGNGRQSLDKSVVFKKDGCPDMYMDL